MDNAHESDIRQDNSPPKPGRKRKAKGEPPDFLRGIQRGLIVKESSLKEYFGTSRHVLDRLHEKGLKSREIGTDSPVLITDWLFDLLEDDAIWDDQTQTGGSV